MRLFFLFAFASQVVGQVVHEIRPIASRKRKTDFQVVEHLLACQKLIKVIRLERVSERVVEQVAAVLRCEFFVKMVPSSHRCRTFLLRHQSCSWTVRLSLQRHCSGPFLQRELQGQSSWSLRLVHFCRFLSLSGFRCGTLLTSHWPFPLRDEAQLNILSQFCACCFSHVHLESVPGTFSSPESFNSFAPTILTLTPLIPSLLLQKKMVC